MSFLLDTHVLSEPSRPTPNRGVLEWLENADEDRLFLSAASFAELHFGIERLPVGKRRERLHEWLREEVTQRFDGRILPIGESIAHRWGVLIARAEATGRPIGVMDGFLAATAATHQLTLVTRNSADFDGILSGVVNPWT